MKKTSAIPSPSELAKKITKVENKLDEMRQMKEILQASGMTPDEDDKKRESALILNLRKLKKMQEGKWILPDASGKVHRPVTTKKRTEKKPATKSKWATKKPDKSKSYASKRP